MRVRFVFRLLREGCFTACITVKVHARWTAWRLGVGRVAVTDRVVWRLALTANIAKHEDHIPVWPREAAALIRPEDVVGVAELRRGTVRKGRRRTTCLGIGPHFA